MTQLINSDGKIDFGVYDTMITDINYMDYHLEKPMGAKIRGPFKKFRFNQFNFIGIMGPELMAGFAIVKFKGLSNGFFYVYDRKANKLFETSKISLGLSASIGCNPSKIDTRFKFPGLELIIDGDKLFAKGKNISINAMLGAEKPEPLRVCARAGYRGWVFTEKTSPVTLTGTLEYNGKTIDLSSPDYMALIDWSAGFMRRNTFWNWASIAGTLPDKRSIGLNLASGVNETAFTENAFWVDGKLFKTDTVNFRFDPDDLMKEWQVTSYDKKIDLVFTPENYREDKTNAILIGTRFTQLMGTFDGTFTTDYGEIIELKGVPGWTEDHYAKW